jgi:hypothetical protein
VGTAAVVLSITACAGSTSSAGDAPLPTIGLGSNDGSAQVSGGADVRSIGNSSIDTVVMIGDSITVGSKVELQAAYEALGFSTIMIQAQGGKRMAISFGDNASGVSIAEFLVGIPAESVGDVDAEADTDGAEDGDAGADIDGAEDGDADSDGAAPIDHSNELWVIALGTNDINQYANPAELAGIVNEMLSIVPAESGLIWVDTFWRAEPEATAGINSIIEDRVINRGDSAVAYWSAVADDEGNLRTDGVHPRDAGSLVFASTISDTIRTFLELE